MTTRIKALTLHQPWASLIIAGAKEWETRDWGTSYEGLLVIHAGKTLDVDIHNRLFVRFLMESGIGDWNKLPLGAAVGAVWKGKCYRGQSVIPHISEREMTFGNFDGPDRVAWHCTQPVPFVPPITMRGQQGLWDWPLPLPDAILMHFRHLMERA